MTIVASGVSRLRPRSPAYDEIMAQHQEAVKHRGIVLQRPTPDLIERARQYAVAVQHNCQNESGHDPRGVNGANFLYTHPQGQLGAELFANYYGTVAGWDPTKSDPGWDIVICGRTRNTLTDAKTRQGLLTLQPYEVTNKAEYYALIEQIDDGPFVFCGVITPMKFRELNVGRPMLALQRSRVLTHWVGAHELEIAAIHFHPRLR